MHSHFSVESYRGPYIVTFAPSIDEALGRLRSIKNPFVLLDKNVLEAHHSYLKPLVDTVPHLLFEATEENKSLEKFPELIGRLGELGVKRDHTLVAVGGGITQDVVCFLAANMFRGMNWIFFPTTLLAQADSCIGSKSSINVGQWKNIIGSFTPPNQVIISRDFLETLKDEDILSGVGEMVKVHIIDGPSSFADIERSYSDILSSGDAMQDYISKSLMIKKKIIEVDEFDRGPRNVMNYGHSFGHAMEAATHFAIPHGIAVTRGMDLANFVSWKMGRLSEGQYAKYSELLRKNAGSYLKTSIPFPDFMSALSKDKKNTTGQIRVILLNSSLVTEIVPISDREFLENTCKEYFNQWC